MGRRRRRGELFYDHRRDPAETANLAAFRKPGTELRRMRGVLDGGWRAARAR